MQIGLMADSHDHLPRIDRAVEVFNRRRVDFVIHGGDFIAPFALGPLERLQCDWATAAVVDLANLGVELIEL